MMGRQRDVIYRVLLSKKKAVALHALSSELDTPSPTLLVTLKKMQSDGLVEMYYGKDKARIMVKVKTIDDYVDVNG